MRDAHEFVRLTRRGRAAYLHTEDILRDIERE
jgi:hypothetical protein